MIGRRVLQKLLRHTPKDSVTGDLATNEPELRRMSSAAEVLIPKYERK